MILSHFRLMLFANLPIEQEATQIDSSRNVPE